MEIKPLNDQVFIKRDPKELVVRGLLIPESSADKATRGVVAFVGPGRLLRNGERAPMFAKPGDRVLFGARSGGEIKVEGQEYLVMHDDDIFSVIEESE